MKKTMIILAAIALVTISGILAFNSSSQPSTNCEGMKVIPSSSSSSSSSSCSCSCS